MSNFRFLTSNYADIDLVNNYFVSSENPQFPIENCFNFQRRSKVWRSQGYWKVETGKNTLKFKESTASTLTASITVGEYTSTTSFLSAIKSALEAVGASTYTVIHDTDLKIKITSNGVGGDGIFSLLLTDSVSTDMALILGFDDSVDLTGSLEYKADLIKINTSEFITLDLGMQSGPTSLCMIGPNNKPLKFSPSAIIKLQGNDVNAWDSPLFEQTVLYDDEVLSILSDNGISLSQYRYWRILFEDQNPYGYIELGAFYLGSHYSPIYGKPQFPFQVLPVDRSETVFSEGGQTFSDIKDKTDRFSVEFFNLKKDEVEYLKDIFFRYGTSKPFFIVFDPEAVFSTSVNRMIRYVKFESEPQFTLVRPNIFRATFVFRGEL